MLENCAERVGKGRGCFEGYGEGGGGAVHEIGDQPRNKIIAVLSQHPEPVQPSSLGPSTCLDSSGDLRAARERSLSGSIGGLLELPLVVNYVPIPNPAQARERSFVMR